MLIKQTLFIALSAAALTACGTSTQSRVADNQPPRMIHHTQNNHSYMWDYSNKFAPVPASEAERAARECNKYKAGSTPHGYSAQALDISGNLIPGGAFSCAG